MRARLPSGMGLAEAAVYEAVSVERRGLAAGAGPSGSSSERPAPIRVAARLLLARAVDSVPELATDLRAGSVVLIDVVDALLFSEVQDVWRGILLGPDARVAWLDKMSRYETWTEYDAAALVVNEPPKPKDRERLGSAVLTVLSWAVPIIGISPSAPGYIPAALQTSARHRLTLPAVDATVLARTVELVTGRRCRIADVSGVVGGIELLDLAVAVRGDRSPAEAIGELGRLQEARARKRGARELTLDELHGLEPAVHWARHTIPDVAAWLRGEISWSAVEHGIVLDGPPGTGKTLFAQAFAAEAKFFFVAASLAKWQSAGHLGDLLKAMRADFNLARSRVPAVLFIDEVDAFPDRSSVTHDHKDYVIEVVNAFIELLDGAEGREGMIFIAASNDIGRTDPAIIRAGRLNFVVRIELPDLGTRVRMLRVRLGGDLPDVDLDRVARLTEGASGADIERVVKLARQTARRAERPLADDDLFGAVTAGRPDRSPELLRRYAVHEAGHALVHVLLIGHEKLTVTLQDRGGAGGWIKRKPAGLAGTRAELEDEITMLLGGRAAEEVALGEASAGSGGILGSDQHLATRLAAAMVGAFGFDGPHPLLFVAPVDRTEEILSHAPLRIAVTEILDRAHQRARSLVVRHRPGLDRIAEALLELRHLDGESVVILLAGDDVGRRTGTDAITGSSRSRRRDPRSGSPGGRS